MANIDLDLPRRLCASVLSVTAQIKDEVSGDLVAEVIRERLLRPNVKERWMLSQYDIDAGDLCWVREVFLQTHGQIHALARICVPRSELSLLPWLVGLGNRPLGSVLFAAYAPSREYIQKEQVTFGQIERQFSFSARAAAKNLGFESQKRRWFRRSVLRLPGQSDVHISVTECFY